VDCNDDFLRSFLTSEPDIRAFIRSLIRDPHVADDVFQEVALTCWREFDSYDRQRSFGAWARGIAANKILQARDRAGRKHVAFSPETVEAILAAFNRTEEDASLRIEALRECVRGLPAKSKQLLSYRYEQSLTGDKIAAIIKASRDAVYKALARIRTGLADCVRRCLESQGRG